MKEVINGLLIDWHGKEVIASSAEKTEEGKLAKTLLSGTYNLKVTFKIPDIEIFDGCMEWWG